MNEELTLKLVRWVIFTAVLSLVPLGILYIALLYASKPHGLANILGNGELLIIAWILGIGGFGELIPEGSTKRIPALACGGLNAVIFICSLSLFVVARYTAGPQESMEIFTTWASIILFIATFFTSAGCVALSEI